MTMLMHIKTWNRPYANVRDSGGPVRVSDETPPEDWEPKPFIGFTSHKDNDAN